MLANIAPPLETRAYVNNIKFCEAAHYGNEWLINNYLLLHHIQALLGPDFQTLLAGKKVSALWVKENYNSCWHSLITEAESWEFGKPMQRNAEVCEFLQFVLNQVKQTEIFKVVFQGGNS
jgi:hypothetical protein